MNVLIALSVTPMGKDEFAPDIAKVVQIIRQSGLKNKTNSMFTEIEGEWDDVMALVKKVTMLFAEKNIRTEVVLKADVRPNYTNMIEGKIERLEKFLDK